MPSPDPTISEVAVPDYDQYKPFEMIYKYLAELFHLLLLYLDPFKSK
jgi:hypothetical protein